MEALAGKSYVDNKVGSGVSGFTTDGGMYQTFINNTGLPSIKGTIVIASNAITNGVKIATANSFVSIGVIYDDGILNGQPIKVVICGKAKVLLKNGQSCIQGDWLGVSDNAGRMYSNGAEPPSTSDHNREIGHSLESKSSGINVLALVTLHFN